VDKNDDLAHSICAEAARIVIGARNDTHGAKERSFQAVADLWNAYLSGCGINASVAPVDVAMMMVLLKVARAIQGNPVRDHFVDMAGYAGLAGSLALSTDEENISGTYPEAEE
jgi:hypothetical protein